MTPSKTKLEACPELFEAAVKLHHECLKANYQGGLSFMKNVIIEMGNALTLQREINTRTVQKPEGEAKSRVDSLEEKYPDEWTPRHEVVSLCYQLASELDSLKKQLSIPSQNEGQLVAIAEKWADNGAEIVSVDEAQKQFVKARLIYSFTMALTEATQSLRERNEFLERTTLAKVDAAITQEFQITKLQSQLEGMVNGHAQDQKYIEKLEAQIAVKDEALNLADDLCEEYAPISYTRNFIQKALTTDSNKLVKPKE